MVSPSDMFILSTLRAAVLDEPIYKTQNPPCTTNLNTSNPHTSNITNPHVLSHENPSGNGTSQPPMNANSQSNSIINICQSNTTSSTTTIAISNDSPPSITTNCIPEAEDNIHDNSYSMSAQTTSHFLVDSQPADESLNATFTVTSIENSSNQNCNNTSRTNITIGDGHSPMLCDSGPATITLTSSSDYEEMDELVTVSLPVSKITLPCTDQETQTLQSSLPYKFGQHKSNKFSKIPKPVSPMLNRQNPLTKLNNNVTSSTQSFVASTSQTLLTSSQINSSISVSCNSSSPTTTTIIPVVAPNSTNSGNVNNTAPAPPPRHHHLQNSSHHPPSSPHLPYSTSPQHHTPISRPCLLQSRPGFETSRTQSSSFKTTTKLSDSTTSFSSARSSVSSKNYGTKQHQLQGSINNLHRPAAGSSASATSKKDPSRAVSANGQSPAADARCIRRMLTGSAPVRAQVNCFASPEFQQRKLQQSEESLMMVDLSDADISKDFSDLAKNANVMLECSSVSDSNKSSSTNVNTTNNSRNNIATSTPHPSRSSLSQLQRRHSAAGAILQRSASSTSVSSTPKWRPAGSTALSHHGAPNTSNSSSDSCIPRPTDLRVTRRVGVDGVVLAWSPVEHECVAGFQVVIGGRVVHIVKSPNRTKALVTGVSMTSACAIGLISVGIDGRCSKPAVVTCDRSDVYKGRSLSRSASATTVSSGSSSVSNRRTAMPTCI